MAVQYREGNIKIKPNNYEDLQQISKCSNCHGACTCDLGIRSTFDQLQFQSMVLGQDNYAFYQKRKLDFEYPSLKKKQISNEGYSGMTDPNNQITYYMWPPRSSNCNKSI